VPLPPLPPRIATAIGRFHAELVGAFGTRLRELVLFGSQARGDATEESDVDLLVVIDHLTDPERRKVIDISCTVGAEGDEYVVLSPLVYATEHATDMRGRERRIMHEIERDGVAV
jgi:uncharacterized protein